MFSMAFLRVFHEVSLGQYLFRGNSHFYLNPCYRFVVSFKHLHKCCGPYHKGSKFSLNLNKSCYHGISLLSPLLTHSILACQLIRLKNSNKKQENSYQEISAQPIYTVKLLYKETLKSNPTLNNNHHYRVKMITTIEIASLKQSTSIQRPSCIS